MAVCANCARQLEDNVLICFGCGQRRKVRQSQDCQNCGAEIGDAVRFCSSCGQEQGLPRILLANSQMHLKIPALILGLLGTLTGSIGAGFVVIEVGNSPAANVDLGFFTLWIVSLVIICIVAMLGASLAIASPKISAELMVLTAVVGTVFTIGFFLVGSAFLGVAALLAYKAEKAS